MIKAKKKKYYKCSRCHKEAVHDKICIIDDKPVCVTCVYGKTKPFKIYPIGMVKNELKRAKRGFGTAGKEGISRIELLESQRPFLFKLEEEKIITIVYYLHEADAVKSLAESENVLKAAMWNFVPHVKTIRVSISTNYPSNIQILLAMEGVSKR